MALSGAIGQIPCNIGIPIAVQYGSSGKNPFHLERLTFDPQLADISGRKELDLIP